MVFCREELSSIGRKNENHQQQDEKKNVHLIRVGEKYKARFGGENTDSVLDNVSMKKNAVGDKTAKLLITFQ